MDINKLLDRVFAGQAGTDTRYNTELSPKDELQFRDWIKNSKINFNPDELVTDYDMRGFYLKNKDDLSAGTSMGRDNRMHFTDEFKTPLHSSFSTGSKFSTPRANSWDNISGFDFMKTPGGIPTWVFNP